MTIRDTVLAALETVLPNTWLVGLPPDPTFPAIVFEIDSTPEQQWVQGGGYDQHNVSVTVLAKTTNEVQNLTLLIKAAMEAIPGYLQDGDYGDAGYEDDASMYGAFSNHTIRNRKDLG
jgi:hypothetical protein